MHHPRHLIWNYSFVCLWKVSYISSGIGMKWPMVPYGNSFRDLLLQKDNFRAHKFAESLLRSDKLATGYFFLQKLMCDAQLLVWTVIRTCLIFFTKNQNRNLFILFVQELSWKQFGVALLNFVKDSQGHLLSAKNTEPWTKVSCFRNWIAADWTCLRFFPSMVCGYFGFCLFVSDVCTEHEYVPMQQSKW